MENSNTSIGCVIINQALHFQIMVLHNRHLSQISVHFSWGKTEVQPEELDAKVVLDQVMNILSMNLNLLTMRNCLLSE